MRVSDEPFISAEHVQRRVRELGEEINADFDGQELVLVIVLKGAIVFASDLMRHLRMPVRLEFMHARSYKGTESTGKVELCSYTGESVSGKNVLLVEDILDTGRTLPAVVAYLREQSPARLAVCALLDKPARRETDAAADYVGFTIEDAFVVGYGLDYEQHFRQLPAIHVMEEGEGPGGEE